MAVSSQQITVSTAAVALNAADVRGMTLHIVNGAQGIALGASNVAAGTGCLIPASGVVDVALAAGDVLYAIRSGGTDSVVSVLRT